MSPRGMCPGGTQGLICLPPISDDLQLIWTQAELTCQLDEHPQLVHTFSYFPYPTMPEIDLLCFRYGLQKEKVKTWFMVQRIRCGISWSPEEIEETRSRLLLYNQDQLHFRPLVVLAKKSFIRTPEEMEIQSFTIESRHEDTPSPFSPSTHNIAPEAKKLRLEYLAPERAQSPTRVRDHLDSYGHSSPNSSLRADLHLESGYTAKIPIMGKMFRDDGTKVSTATACLPSEEDRYQGMDTQFCTNNGHGNQEPRSGTLREDSYMTVMKRHRKTKEQLAILKAFFLKCQWACREDYKNLEEITGVPRADIAQWFGDTRYALKQGQVKWFWDNAQGRPSWLDEVPHPITQNGRQADPKPGVSTVKLEATPVVEVPENDKRLPVLPRTVTAGYTPVVKAGAAVNNCPESSMTTAPEITFNTLTFSATERGSGIEHLAQERMDENSAFSDRSKTERQVMATDLETGLAPPSPRSTVPGTSLQEHYGVLKRYWQIHQHIKEEDVQSLVTESGLGRQQVLDWFCHKSNEPAEVEVSLEEEEQDVDDDDHKGEGDEEEG
ncbi:LOW QUALITY PROTEIN: homeobox and leucine zipper protein Homez [Pelodytes ibericus]